MPSFFSVFPSPHPSLTSPHMPPPHTHTHTHASSRTHPMSDFYRITCNSGTVGKAGKEQKSDLPIIRVKSRRQTVEILPLDAYQSFIQVPSHLLYMSHFLFFILTQPLTFSLTFFSFLLSLSLFLTFFSISNYLSVSHTLINTLSVRLIT